MKRIGLVALRLRWSADIYAKYWKEQAELLMFMSRVWVSLEQHRKRPRAWRKGGLSCDNRLGDAA
jgi:hypothetical protein